MSTQTIAIGGVVAIALAGTGMYFSGERVEICHLIGEENGDKKEFLENLWFVDDGDQHDDDRDDDREIDRDYDRGEGRDDDDDRDDDQKSKWRVIKISKRALAVHLNHGDKPPVPTGGCDAIQEPSNGPLPPPGGGI